MRANIVARRFSQEEINRAEKRNSRNMTKSTKWLCTQHRSAWASAQSSQSSLCAQWVDKDPMFLHADSEDSDQTGRMPRLIGVFAGRTATLLVLLFRGSFGAKFQTIFVVCFFFCFFFFNRPSLEKKFIRKVERLNVK